MGRNENGYAGALPAAAVMTTRWEAELPRLARLARLSVAPEEAPALARACEAIATEFGDLATYAGGLPEADPSPVGALREDRVEEAPPSEVEGILAAAPRIDKASRAVLVPRGGP